MTLATELKLAGALARNGEYGKAVPVYRHVFEARRRVLGPDHATTVASKWHLAAGLHWAGEDSEASKFAKEVLASKKHELGEDDPDVAAILDLIASIDDALGMPDSPQ